MAMRSNTKSRSKGWASLPDLALDLIFQKSSTSLSDCLCFGAVCKSWFSFMSRNYDAQRICMNSSSFEELPLLMIYPGDRDCVTNLYSVTKGKIISDLKLPYYTWRCCGSSHGWLAFQNPLTFCLFNPFSRETIDLPHLEFNVHKLILSKNPSTSSCDFEVMAMSKTWGQSKLAILKPGSKTWIPTHLPVVRSSFHDVIYYNERYYVVTYEGRVLSINNTASEYEQIAPASINEAITGFREFYLVKTTTNKLLKVQITGRYDRQVLIFQSWFQVHRPKNPCLQN
ncbi:PREDICTED: F-box protein At4g00893-like [Nicotiana attenuata]|uniref:KIB1-4 beta-propeller domain-containing protein n=1 Tax=Nicotiana attenuata TaxID=49451 RepID=A0A314KXV0_NICAT|nr:PREDICTED: F-box protein At4g00893-like [Nicotiana attenuata]OIT34052.1 hypothetical protein A4A49_54937 [Nicotiana attenuata]